MADAGYRYGGGTTAQVPSKSTAANAGDGTTATTQTSGANTSNTTSSGTRDAVTNTRQQNMSPQDQQALDLLIQQLMGGGTQQMAEDRARKIQLEQTLQGVMGGYSKGNAFTDAQGAMAQQLRMVMEKIAPVLVRAAEGAGTSQNSMRALLMQQGANQAAESASALGLKAAVDYGGVANQTSNILAQLIAQADPTTAALLQALNVAKGSVSNTQSTVNETSTGNSSTTGTSNNSSTVSSGSGGSSSNSGSSVSTPLAGSQMMTSISALPQLGSGVASPYAPTYTAPNQQLLDLLDSAGGYSSSYKF